MSGLYIRMDQDFVNGLVDKVIESNTKIPWLKNLNVQIKDEGMHFQADIEFMGEEKRLDSLITIKNKPQSLSQGSLVLALSGEEGIVKILQGMFLLLSRFSDGFNSRENNIEINLEKISTEPFIREIFSCMKLDKMDFKDGEILMELSYRESD